MITINKNVEEFDDLLYYENIKESYKDPGLSITIKEDQTEPLVKMLLEIEPNSKKYEFRDKRGKTAIFIQNDDFFLRITMYGKISEVSYYTSSLGYTEFLNNMLIDYTTDEDIVVNRVNISLGSNGLKKTQGILYDKNFEDLSETYYPFLNVEKLFSKFQESSESILGLLGLPGCGKTKLSSIYIKKLLDGTIQPKRTETHLVGSDEDFANLPNFYSVAIVKDVNVLSSPLFWEDLTTSEYTAVILDDLDYFLVQRDSDVRSEIDNQKNQFMSELLSFTDGIVKNDTKFIITTNQPVSNIDSALLRRGRVFDILEFRYLKREEAMGIWKSYNLSEEDFVTVFEDNETIKQSDLGSEIEDCKRRIERGESLAEGSYLLDDISIIKRIRKGSKKLSLL